MKKGIPPAILYLALLILYLLHNDLWLWDNASLVMGIPSGLFYHIVFCFAAAGLMALVVNHAWPRHLRTPNEKESDQ